MLIKYPVNNILQKFRNTSYNTNNKKQVEFCIFQPRYYLWYITFYIIIFDIYIQIYSNISFNIFFNFFHFRYTFTCYETLQFTPFTAIKNTPRKKIVAFIKSAQNKKFQQKKNVYLFLTLNVIDVNKNYYVRFNKKKLTHSNNLTI